MAIRTEGLDLSDPNDRKKAMGWCRKAALQKLARLHRDEFRALVRLEYAEAGIEVRPFGMTAEQKKARRIQRLRAQLAELEQSA